MLVARHWQCAPVLLDLNDLSPVHRVTKVAAESLRDESFSHSTHSPSKSAGKGCEMRPMDYSQGVHDIVVDQTRVSIGNSNDLLLE